MTSSTGCLSINILGDRLRIFICRLLELSVISTLSPFSSVTKVCFIINIPSTQYFSIATNKWVYKVVLADQLIWREHRAFFWRSIFLKGVYQVNSMMKKVLSCFVHSTTQSITEREKEREREKVLAFAETFFKIQWVLFQHCCLL